MNLTVDIGNTAVKWATFEGSSLMENGEWKAESGGWKAENFEQALACASGTLPKALTGIPLLTADTPLPIRLDYKTPKTLGADRIAAACGAWALHRGEDCLVIDAGTCITVDFLDHDGVYHGGAIMPGIRMNLQALHTFTAKLPLIEIDPGHKAPVLGRSTEESIVAGTMGATMLALAGYVALYRQKSPALHVLLTGGDAALLAQAGTAGWEQVPMLTFTGLNEILLHNGEQK